MNFPEKGNGKSTLAHPRSRKRKPVKWQKIASVMLCMALLGTNVAGASAAETSIIKKPSVTIVSEDSNRGGEGPESTATSSDAEKKENTATSSDAALRPETGVEKEAVYTLHLTHVFRFTLDGRGRYVQATETRKLKEEDFENGICDLTRFCYDAEQIAVIDAKTISIGDFDENLQGGARIVYGVKSGWRIVRKGNADGEGNVLREVFNGGLSDYEFVPANVVRINMEYKYSNTGGLAGVDAASPDTVEAIPEKQDDGTYKVEWKLPTVNGFRIVLDPSELNAYVVNPPTGNETPAEMEAALERGDFDVDINNHTIYYYQEISGSDQTVQHPTYQNRYSTEYNEAWNDARWLKVDGDEGYFVQAVCGSDNPDAHPLGVENHGANALVDPKLEVTLTKEQLNKIMEGETELKITVYYRRNATWYTVNHWVPENLSGLSADIIAALDPEQKRR